jgi:hypothetical protein
MSARILRGTKQEIAANLARLSGEVREAIVFVDEPRTPEETPSIDSADPFAEMTPLMVEVPVLDDTRETIYTRMGGE